MAERTTLPQKLRRNPEDGRVYVDKNGDPRGDHFVDDPSGGDPVVTLAIAATTLDFRVRLFDSSGIFNPGLPWREGSGEQAQMHFRYPKLKAAQHQVGLTRESPVSYEVQMLVVAKPPTRKPVPVYRDWCRRFFPGGLPSLNKRRR